MQKVKNEYLELQLVIDEFDFAEKFISDLESETDSIITTSDVLMPDVSECDGSGADNLLQHLMDEKIPEKMAIPVEIIEIICQKELSFWP